MTRKADKIPKGFMTARQWATKENISLGHAQKLLTELVHTKNPKVERRHFLLSLDGGPRRVVAHYRLLK